MGVKAIKEKYGILHIVQKKEENICIGSPYMSEIIVINPDGKLIVKYKNRKYDDGWSINENLKRYQEEMIIDSESGELKRLFHLKDEVNDLIPVYTYKKAKVLKTYCEKYGWPETTIDGEIMYDNTFFRTYEEAYESLLSNTKIRYYEWGKFKDNIKDGLRHISRAFKYLFRDIFEYIYSRTFQWMIGKIKYKVYTFTVMRIHDLKNWQIGVISICLFYLAWWALLMLYCAIYEPTETKEIFKPRVVWEGQSVG